MMIIPLKNLHGEQFLNGNQIRIMWECPERMGILNAYIWVYRENSPGPIIRKYINNNYLDINQLDIGGTGSPIQKIKYLVFLSDSTMPPTPQMLYQMSQKEEFICSIYCGKGEVGWFWKKNQMDYTLELFSEKQIPEGLLFYRCRYGKAEVKYRIPGTIYPGKNEYHKIYFSEEPPIIQAEGTAVTLYEKQMKQWRWPFRK